MTKAMKPSMNRLCDFIRTRGAELGFSQNEVARASGLNPGTLANITTGRVAKAPAVDTLEKLAAGLQVDGIFLYRLARGESITLTQYADPSTVP